MIKIMAGPLFHLALAAANERTNKSELGRPSKSVLIDVFYLTQCDAVKRQTYWRGGYWGCRGRLGYA